MPALIQSRAADSTRRRASRSSRASSTHPANRSQSVSSASCASSTVGVLLAGSRSKVSSRWRPYSASTVSRSSGGDPGLLELRPTDTPACVAMLLGDADEPEEHQLHCGAAALVERLVDLLGAAADRAGDTTDLVEVGDRDRVRRPRSEQLRQGVLHEGQRTGLQLGFGDDAVHDPGLDLHTDRGRRQPHRVGQLVRRHRPECDRPTVDRVVEAGVGEWPVEVVGAQRGDETNGRIRRLRHVHQHSEERASLGVIDGLREQLLQLVDHDEHAGVAGRQLVDDRTERARRRQERPDDVGKIGAGDASERCGQLLERLAPGNEFGDEPARRSLVSLRPRAPAAGRP